MNQRIKLDTTFRWLQSPSSPLIFSSYFLASHIEWTELKRRREYLAPPKICSLAEPKCKPTNKTHGNFIKRIKLILLSSGNIIGDSLDFFNAIFVCALVGFRVPFRQVRHLSVHPRGNNYIHARRSCNLRTNIS